jgi:type I restriction enzyme, S subunit
MTVPVARRYDAYKASEAEWLGEVPSAWNVVRTKELFAERNQRSLAGEETLLTVSHITGVTPRSEKNVNMFMADTMEGYKVCHGGDLVVNTMWAWMGALGTSPYDGICSPSYGVYAPRKGLPYCARYYDYLFRTPNAIVEMTRFSKGIVSSRLRLYSDKFFQIAVPLPDFATQQAIADYLDAKTAQIDRKIDLLTQKAGKYRQLRESLINEAVTRGLDNSVPMKDSGVAWIGKVPAHWRIDRLKSTVTSCVNGVWGEEPDGINDVVCIRVADFDRSRNRIADNVDYTYRAIQENQRTAKAVIVGDLLLEKSGGGERQPVGAVMLFDHRFDAVCSNFVARMKVHARENSEYLCYLHSALYAIRLNVRSIKQNTGIQNLDSTAYLDELVALPPYCEQQAIADYLDNATAEIDRIVETINRQVTKLKELRKALINDVVTGKLRVT